MEQLDVDQKILEKDVNPVCFWGFDFWHIVLKKIGPFVLNFILYSFFVQRGTVQNSTSRIHHSSFVTEWYKMNQGVPKQS